MRLNFILAILCLFVLAALALPSPGPSSIEARRPRNWNAAKEVYKAFREPAAYYVRHDEVHPYRPRY
jgi:hypothetical protein